MDCGFSFLRPSVWRSDVHLCLTNVFQRMSHLSFIIRQTEPSGVESVEGNWFRDRGECDEHYTASGTGTQHGQTISLVFHGIVMCCECTRAH